MKSNNNKNKQVPSQYVFSNLGITSVKVYETIRIKKEKEVIARASDMAQSNYFYQRVKTEGFNP